MGKRSTFPVQDLKGIVNNMLAKSIDEAKQQRQGMIAVIERVLMDTDNYHGFQYLDSEFEPKRATDEHGIPYPKLRDGYDDTRRRYY